jgi:hypothetical protein
MANCPECFFYQACELARELVDENPDGMFGEGTQRAKQRELNVMARVFRLMPDDPSCDELREANGNTSPLVCPKSSFVMDAARFVLGSPDVAVRGGAADVDTPFGFGTNQPKDTG